MIKANAFILSYKYFPEKIRSLVQLGVEGLLQEPDGDITLLTPRLEPLTFKSQHGILTH